MAAFACVITMTPHVRGALNNFVTRSGDKLYDGAYEFRFIGCNMCDLAQSWRGGVHTPDPWEQEDAICAVATSGGRVVRPFVISVKKSGDPAGVKFIENYNSYNENVFRGLDKALQLANLYGVRLIIPLVGVGTEPRGGAKDFAAFRGCTTQLEFFTNATVRQDYKNFISYLLNRTNYYTGVQYKNDKAVLCWELGNELVPGTEVDAWSAEMAAYIKGIDPNHLVMDGRLIWGGISSAALGDPNIDVVTSHLYFSHLAYETACRNVSRNLKPLVFGEFGYADTPTLHSLVEQVIADGSSGALLWNMAYRNKNGGFYWDNSSDCEPYRAYRWPGISGVGTAFDESGVLGMMYAHSYKIVTGNENAPAIPVPDAPQIVPITSKSDIRWRGAVGAVSYKIQRSNSLWGPFSEVASGLVDVPTDPAVSYSGFNDTAALSSDTPYFYKMIALNAAGQMSNESNINCLMNNPATIIIDNGGAGFSTAGTWTNGSGSGYNSNYLHDGTSGTDAGKWAKWTPTISAAGNYDVSMYWSAHSNRPTAAPLTITYNGGTDSTKTVNQQINGGQWNYIGTYNFAAGTAGSVQILCSNAGYTIADAVKFAHNSSPILLWENFEDGVFDGWTISNPWGSVEAVTAAHDANYDGVMQMNKASELMVSAGDTSWKNYTAETSATIINDSYSWPLPGLIFRRVDDANCYMFRLTNSTTNLVQLYKRVNGNFTLLGEAPFTIVTGTKYTLRVVVNGSSITCSVNGTSMITATDSAFSAGNVGFRTLNGTAYFGKMLVWR